MPQIDLAVMSTVIGLLAGAGALIAGIGFAYAQFMTGTNKAKDDLIQTLRDAAEAEKGKAERLAVDKNLLTTSHQQQINELNEKIGKLQGLYEASEANKQEYLKILQGRDPQQQEFMKKTLAILESMQIFLDKINKTTLASKAFQDEIAHDTKNNKGKVLKKNV